MVDELCDTPDKHQLTHVGGGHAVIYGPDGRPLVDKLPEDAEGLLIAELDLGLIGVAKNAMDPVGHYSRPDVYRLLLNKKPGKRVEHMALPLDAVDPNAEATPSAP
jgi:aliphatic nitrilase